MSYALAADLPAALSGSQGSSSHLTAQVAHDNLRRSLAALCKAEASVFLWFAEIERRKFYRDLGYSSMQAYAAEELDFSANRVNRYLHLIGELERLPQIRAALDAGEIGWTKARTIVGVSSPATEKRWLTAARRLGRRDLEEKVTRERKVAAVERRGNPGQPDLMARTCRGPADTPSSRLQNDSGGRAGDEEPVFRPREVIDAGPVAVTYRFTPVELARHEAQMETIRKQRSVPAGASREQILARALELLIASGGTDEDETEQDRKPVPRGTAAPPYQIVIYNCETCRAAVVQTQRGPKVISRAQHDAANCDAVLVEPGKRNRSAIPPKVRQKVLIRGEGRCQAPGCGNRRFSEIHHIIPRELGGTNAPENLVVLCSRCHELWHRKNFDARLLEGRRE